MRIKKRNGKLPFLCLLLGFLLFLGGGLFFRKPCLRPLLLALGLFLGRRLFGTDRGKLGKQVIPSLINDLKARMEGYALAAARGHDQAGIVVNTDHPGA